MVQKGFYIYHSGLTINHSNHETLDLAIENAIQVINFYIAYYGNREDVKRKYISIQNEIEMLYIKKQYKKIIKLWNKVFSYSNYEVIVGNYEEPDCLAWRDD